MWTAESSTHVGIEREVLAFIGIRFFEQDVRCQPFMCAC